MAAITEWSQEGLDGSRLDAIVLPERLPLLPVRNFLAAPRAVTPLLVARPLTLGALDAAERGTPATLAVFAQRDPATEHVRAEDLHPVGCQVLLRVRAPYESGVHVIVQGVRWIELQNIEVTPTHLIAQVAPTHARPASDCDDHSLRAAVALVRERARRVAKLTLPDPEAALAVIDTLPADPLGDLVIVNVACAVDDRARYAAEHDPIARMQILISLLDQQLAQLGAG